MKVTGGYMECVRLKTGLWSFDHALSNDAEGAIGAPVGVYEFFGAEATGKTTICASLAGIFGRMMEKDISWCPIESTDLSLVSRCVNRQGFEGELHFCQGITKTKIDKQTGNRLSQNTDESLLDELEENLRPVNSNFRIGVIDSLGGVSSVKETEGDLGQGYNNRPVIHNQFMRKVTKIARFLGGDDPFALFMTNHVQVNIGFAGVHTVGGSEVRYLSRARIAVEKTKKAKEGKFTNMYDFADGSHMITGKVSKFSYGAPNKIFHFFNLGGYGLHLGLTAVIDCMSTGLAVQDRRVVHLGGEKIASIDELMEAAKKNENSVFEPFVLALNTTQDIHYEINDEEGEE